MRLFLASVLAILASQAAALSCMQPDAVRSFERFAAADETYIVLLGEMDFDASKQPKGVVNEQRYPDPIPARFRGLGLTPDGFTHRIDRAVTLQNLCRGPWCGIELPREQSLIFAQSVGDELIVVSEPCGGTIFSNPTENIVADVTACMQGNCPPRRR